MQSSTRPIVVRARTVITCDTTARQCGINLHELGRIDDAAILVEEGRIAAVGKRPDVEAAVRKREIVEFDFPDCIVVPGLVDAHAHPLFAGHREADFVARQRGEKPPLGMLYTVERTRRALLDPNAFFGHIVRPRLQMMLAHGTTTLETKTGYALHKPGEAALLDLIAAHRDDPDIPRLVSTFLGAHALPPEFTREEAFVDYLVDQVVPAARAHGAVYADAFCEPGFFSPQQARRYLEAARRQGMRLRVHCDEMAFGAAAEMAAAIDVDAVDHCNYIRDADVNAIVRRDIVTVACPATIAYLDLPRRVPARALLEAGGLVALASDFNPGTSPCFNLQTVAYFGRALFGLSAAEALYGVTRAAGRSLRVDAGRIAAGCNADFVVLQLESPDEFGWQFGGNLARRVFRGGSTTA
ncbi:MAG: amidohydrolase family protein [Candidatus Eremiobacteraeota bacterium]|nr:amidohydrolase family protein [Candidatus Eremiobacteraeota bacterium]